MALSTDEINIIAKAVEQSISQKLQALDQALQAAQQTGGSLSADKKVLGYEHISEDIGTDEAYKAGTFATSELWNLDKKILAEREQATAQKSHDYDKSLKEIEVAAAKIELARKQSDFNHAEQLKAIAISEAQQAATFKHILNMEYAKFNAAVSEPINPTAGTEKKKK